MSIRVDVRIHHTRYFEDVGGDDKEFIDITYSGSYDGMADEKKVGPIKIQMTENLGEVDHGATPHPIFFRSEESFDEALFSGYDNAAAEIVDYYQTTYPDLTFVEGLPVRTDQQTQNIINDVQNTASTAISEVSSLESSFIDGMNAINVALADHAAEGVGVHAAAFAVKQDQSANLDAWSEVDPEDFYLSSEVDTLLSGKAPISHTHVANDISNASSIGKTVLTSADAAAVRTAIGAGTSSFSGAYNDLTGKPSLSTVATSGDYYDLATKPAAKSFSYRDSYSFVTTAAAANGDRLSTFRDTQVSYNVTVSAAVQIGVVTNVGGYAVLEIAATNSSTASDWKEIARVGTAQNIGLALALASTQTVTGVLAGIVPAGYYRRIRTVNVNGTPTFTYLSGHEALLEPLQTAA